MTDAGPRRVLVTGIAGSLAGKLAARLEADERVAYVGGVDLTEPTHDLVRTEFVRADLRNPLVAKVVESTRVDTIVHMGLISAPGEVGGRARMKELNVIGAMQLLGAAQKAPRLRRVVVKSTTAVYGSHYADPALFREDDALGAGTTHGYTKDALEVERYARAFARRRDDATLTVLRCANLVGPTVDSVLTRYLSLPVVPTVFGHDPRLQLCHEDDAVEVLVRSVMGDHPGTYNVAGPGIVYLSQAIRLAGKASVPVPAPATRFAANLLRATGRVDFPADQLALLHYGRVGDITRLRERFGYEPGYSTREAFEDFVGAQRVQALVNRDTAERMERGLYEFIARKEAAPAERGSP